MVTILFIDDLRNPNTVIQNLGRKKLFVLIIIRLQFKH